MKIHARIAKVIEQLDAIDFYEKVLTHCEVSDMSLSSNEVVRGELIERLYKLDVDAYQAYLADDQAVLDKYYRRKEVA